MAQAIYEIGFANENGPEIDWVNQPPGVIKGPFHHPRRLFEHTGIGSGVPLEPETPLLQITVAGGSDPISDVEPGPATRWYISRKAKDVFERLDASAFDFRLARTRVRTKEGEADGPDYYICDVVRFVDALDMNRSRVSSRPGPDSAVAFYYDDNVFRPTEIGAHLVFRLMRSTHRVMCTEAFRSAVIEADLTKIAFRKMGIVDAD